MASATWYLERANPRWNKELQKQLLEQQQLEQAKEEVHESNTQNN